MDNKILSAAIIAALAAPMSAMADTTVYGMLHMSVGAVDSSESGAGADPYAGEDNMQVRSHASRLGFKGSEDLGGGLKANFKLEYEVNPDGDGTGAGLARRDQWLGLSGDSWGEFRVGRHDTPLKMAQGKFDQFNDTDADIKTLVNGEQRVDNVIAYLSPSWSGFSVAAAGIAGEADKCEEAGNLLGAGCPALPVGTAPSDRTGLADTYSLAAMYENGPLFASLAYNDYDAIGSSGGLDTIMRAIATYKFGDFQVGGLYETSEFACSNCDDEVWGLSGKFSIGNIDLKAQYLDGTYELGTGLSDVEADQWTLGVDYNFSKRTTAYFMYTSLEADDSNAPAVKEEYDFTGVGMIHKF